VLKYIIVLVNCYKLLLDYYYIIVKYSYITGGLYITLSGASILFLSFL